MSVSAASATGDLSNYGLSAGLASTLNPTVDANLAAKAPLTSYQQELQTLNQQDTAELFYASGLSQSDAIANGNAVLSQAANLLAAPGTLNYTTIPNLPTPGTIPSTTTSNTNSSGTTPASTSQTIAAPALKSITDILAESDASAQAALTAYGNAPAGSSIVDYSA